MKMRTVIIGGVAGGASTAARLRRLDEHREIIVIERGPYVSFANCGLPYYLGGEITDRKKLLVQTPERLKALLNIEVKVEHEAISIDRGAKHVRIRNLQTGEELDLGYDNLVLATGAQGLIPPIPGISGPGQFALRTIPDMDHIHEFIERNQARSAVIVGGGYIGIEAAEQLQRRGLAVTVVERSSHILTPFDADMVSFLESELLRHDIRLIKNNPVSTFTHHEGAWQAGTLTLEDGTTIEADLVVLAIGVRPESRLAQAAGLELGKFSGIRVNEHLQTSDPAIYAVGDSIEVRDLVTGEWAHIALAGPANRQGRVVADNIAGKKTRYRGSLGTAILRVFDLAAACTGANETKLKRAGISYQAVYAHPKSHAGYYPGGERISMKLLFSPDSRRLLGAQCIGADGVDKRIDVLATALMAQMTIDDIAELELAYAPPFGSAKDAINLVAMAAQNILNHDVPVMYWHELAHRDVEKSVLLDVRDQKERDQGTIPGSLHIPVAQLRDRHAELPRDREIICFCASGQRSAIATRLLLQQGFSARNLSGAYITWSTAIGQ